MAYVGVVKVGIGRRLEDGAEGGIWKKVQESKGRVRKTSVNYYLVTLLKRKSFKAKPCINLSYRF